MHRRSVRPYLLAVLGATSVAFACNGHMNTTGPRGAEASAAELPLQTDTGSYRLERAAGGRVEVGIGVRYTNRTPRPAHISTCHSPHPPLLEKLIDGEWVTAYSPIVLLCAGPPLVIAAGTTYHYDYRVVGYPRGGNTHPQFEIDEVPGTYRLRWLILEQHAPSSTGLISNEFQIIE